MQTQFEQRAPIHVTNFHQCLEAENPVAEPTATLMAQTTTFLDIPAALTHVHLLSRCACGLLENLTNLTEVEATLYNLELAIQEIGVNIVTHAYAHHAGRIRMTLTLEEEPLRLIILLHDTGQSFDPGQVPSPRLGELQEHGFGLFLVRQLMDEVEYTHSPMGNTWKLTKNIGMTHL